MSSARLSRADCGFFLPDVSLVGQWIDEGDSVVGNYWDAGALHDSRLFRNIGPSPSGKAAGFGPAIPRFES